MITTLITVATVAVSFFGFQNENLFRKYVFDTRKIVDNRQIYRMITSAFFHVNWMHLLFNMFSFYAFATYMETALGPGELLILYFLSVAGGSLLSLILNKDRDYQAVGASGGVSGVIFSSIFVYPGGAIRVFPIPIPIPPWLYALLFVFISMYGLRKQAGNIGHDAHLGGALTGLLFTLLIHPQVIMDAAVFFVVVMLAIVLFIFYVIKFPAGR